MERKETAKFTDTAVTSDIENGETESINDSRLGIQWWLNKIRLPDVPNDDSKWSNADLEPTPPEQQIWHSLNFTTYWLCDAIAPGNLRLGSSIVTLGLSWQTAIGIITLGHFLISLAITANGVVGARLHIPYTIQSRASFGFFFSFVVVFIRMLVGLFWYGINTYNGALCVRAVLLAIWPSFAKIPNHLPKSANITTQMMTSYIIYFLVVLPFHYIHPRKLKWFFNMKVLLCLPAIFGMLGWACNETGGGLHTTLLKRGNTISGSKYGWAFMSALNSMLGNYGTMAVNINDFARYSRKTRSVFVQILIIPLAFAMMAFWGVIIAGAATDLYGEEIWDPLTVLSHWTGSRGARAGAAFCGLAFALAQLGTNLSANCISAANDLNAMFPRYINLRRGSYVVAFIGAWALTPWNILASASALLNFMDGYTIWLAPITGVLLSDYWIVQHQSYVVPELYQPDARYRYNRLGTNWRALAAWCISWIPLTPGFSHAVSSSNTVASGALHLYYLSYLFALLTSAVLYVGLSTLWPARCVRKSAADASGV
ncbi:hypothetical protein AC578_222 [Pseudocercospora eumusae]|uniref:NCS1 nucleoside transporter family n=1 Tax=Pseudocercospora eumusae TaxID=321146 RepID=A0A139HIM0_9PEZI|nr:hypothetical protein AC578_222 [Pseudocercospora eumusae]KXT02332.1 hypothetical protein AC578_222 [Pseudocercospora eumusae]